MEDQAFDFETSTDADGNICASANAIAEAVSMNPKSVRRRIRQMTDQRAGRGGRWVFSVEDATAIANRILHSDGRTETRFSFKD